MKELRGYKVLTKDRRSCIVSCHNGARIYKKNVKTIPKCGYGPLCVFETKRNAQDFTLKCNIIVKCKYTESKQVSIWEFYGGTKYYEPFYLLPQGTVLASSVTCLE